MEREAIGSSLEIVTTGGLCRRALRGSTPLTTHNLEYALCARPRRNASSTSKSYPPSQRMEEGNTISSSILGWRTAFETDVLFTHRYMPRYGDRKIYRVIRLIYQS